MDRKPLILIIEDEKEIAKFIDLELQAESYETVVTYDGVTGLSKFRELNPDLVVARPDAARTRRARGGAAYPQDLEHADHHLDGERFRRRQGAGPRLGVRTTTSSSRFRLRELLARVRAHLRRVNPAVTGEVRVADLVMNLDGREVFRDGRRIELSAKEFELLELFAREPRQGL